MTSLQKPPTPERPSRIVARMAVLLVMVLLLGVAIWSAVTEQRIELTEDTSLDSLELDSVTSDGLAVNLRETSEGAIPVLLLHDFDVAGGVLMGPIAESLGDGFGAVRLDLPGFGLSQRMPTSGQAHTVASLANVVAGVVMDRFEGPVVAAGVGLGGEVAAELSVSHPELVRGLVMVDVDFSHERTWVDIAESFPYIGRSVVYTFEGGGRLGVDQWAPRCDEGGWCPTADQVAARDLAASVVGTTDSLKAFIETPRASLVPSDLDTIEAPVTYVWSTEGTVSEDSIDEIRERIPDISVVEAPVWKAHLESPRVVADAIEALGA